MKKNNSSSENFPSLLAGVVWTLPHNKTTHFEFCGLPRASEIPPFFLSLGGLLVFFSTSGWQLALIAMLRTVLQFKVAYIDFSDKSSSAIIGLHLNYVPSLSDTHRYETQEGSNFLTFSQGPVVIYQPTAKTQNVRFFLWTLNQFYTAHPRPSPAPHHTLFCSACPKQNFSIVYTRTYLPLSRGGA